MTSTRIALRLALGILCGVALVALPSVFSTGPTNPSSNLSGQTVQPFQHALQPAANGLNAPGTDALSFLTIALFIFLPSTVFSLLIRRWAEKRARSYSWSD
jgi:hypothetical protein